MEGHVKTYTIPHPAQPRDLFFNSSPVKSLEPVFRLPGAPRAATRFETWEGHRPRMTQISAAKQRLQK